MYPDQVHFPHITADYFSNQHGGQLIYAKLDPEYHAHDQYTETKTIWIDLNDPTEGDNVG